MMLESISSGLRKHGVLVGAVAGASFPLLAFAIQAGQIGLTEAARLMLTSPSHAVSFAFPVLATVFAQRLVESRQRIEKLEAEKALREYRLAQDAFFDPLTGLPNRRRLGQDIAAMQARAGAGALLLLDIDKFKFVNDTMGHDAGDEMLKRIAAIVQAVLAQRGLLYRLGGDEFVVLAEDICDEESVAAICRAIEVEAGRPIDLPQGRVAAGVSIGVTFVSGGGEDLTAIFKRADLALYRAKEISGSSHAFFDPLLAEQALERIEIERDLLRALADGEFFIEYQPILNILSRRVMCFEALLRWRHPVKGLIAPDNFIPLAERTGLILPIGRWVLREACLEASGWPQPVSVAINVSGDQFKDRGFVAYVKEVLAESGLDPRRLTIEVTESVFTVDVSIIQESLMELREAGIKIALDDFGTGFSSINNLKRFPLDQLKIDRSFTAAMLRGGSDSELVNLMSRLGDAFQLSTTIEGIETETQLEFARLMGIRNVQGFLISRPIPAEGIAALLAQGDRKQAANDA